MNAPERPTDLRQALMAAARLPRLLVASDFDGTLAPIVSNPADARPLPDAAAALRDLAALPLTTAALISGRALGNLATLSQMPPEVSLVGSHGAEFSDGFLQPIDDDARALLGRVENKLQGLADYYPGVTIEVKLASVAIHVRNASPEDAYAAIEAAALTAGAMDDVYITEGKAVLEVAVVPTDKGAALDILREESDASAVVFFGDDVTDEKAFNRLDGDDVGVKVGPGSTLAEYRVDSPADVATALKLILDERRRNWQGSGI